MKSLELEETFPAAEQAAQPQPSGGRGPCRVKRLTMQRAWPARVAHPCPVPAGQRRCFAGSPRLSKPQQGKSVRLLTKSHAASAVGLDPGNTDLLDQLLDFRAAALHLWNFICTARSRQAQLACGGPDTHMTYGTEPSRLSSRHDQCLLIVELKERSQVSSFIWKRPRNIFPRFLSHLISSQKTEAGGCVRHAEGKESAVVSSSFASI